MKIDSLHSLSLVVAFTVTLAHSSSMPIVKTITVSKDGKGDTTTIQGAINMVPENNVNWIRIRVSPGNYWEQVTIPPTKPYIFLEGYSRHTTVIAYDGHASTSTSATFTSLADYFVAKGITFKNAYLMREGRDGNVLVPALAIDIHGNKAAFYACGFMGMQDTIFDAVGLHYFHRCYIEGTIDFIFGCGRSFYQECLINVTRGKNVSPSYQYGYITAQGLQSANDPSGFVFSHCTVTGSFKAYLGRAYREYSRVLFISSYLSDVILPKGWVAWKAKGKENNLVNIEAECRGPGSELSDREKWVHNARYPNIKYYSTVSYVNEGNWLGNIPVFPRNYSQTNQPIHLRGGY